MSTFIVKIEPLTREAYAPYGDVIDMEGVDHFSINEGAIERLDVERAQNLLHKTIAQASDAAVRPTVQQVE